MPAAAAAGELMSALSSAAPSARTRGIVHVVVEPRALPVVVQAAAVVPDVGDVEHHVLGQPALERHRPVLEARQRLAVGRHGRHASAVGDGGVDERRVHDVLRREPESRRNAG